MKNKIILISGDPNSINSEIIYKSWKKLNSQTKKKIYLITNLKLFQNQLKKLKYNLSFLKVNNIDENLNSKRLKILDLNLNFKNPFRVKPKSSSSFVLRSLNYGHNLALRKDVIGIINCPINKNLLKKKNIGVTEYLAKKCRINDNSEAMLIFNKRFSVSPITTHINVKKISNKLTKKIIVNKTVTINKWFKKQYLRKPKIGITGLNPHNAELSSTSEEKKIIIPSILNLRKRGLNIKGPLVGDTLFIRDYTKYDIIIGMYHDQVLIPFKTLFKFDAINLTLGLKYLRVSPDHGVARNLIGEKKANPQSLLNCINFVNRHRK